MSCCVSPANAALHIVSHHHFRVVSINAKYVCQTTLQIYTHHFEPYDKRLPVYAMVVSRCARVCGPVKWTADSATRMVARVAADRLLVGMRRADDGHFWIDACGDQALTAGLQARTRTGIRRGWRRRGT